MSNILSHINYNSPVILTYFFLCLAILIFNIITRNKYSAKFFETYRTTPSDILSYPRLVTHILGHADFDHFISNFAYILVLGPTLEERFGSKEIFIFIIATGFTIGVIHNLISDSSILGSSGILYSFIVLTSYVNIEANKIPLTLIIVCTLFISREIIRSFKKDDHISHSAHIIGALCGIVFVVLLKKGII